MTSLLSKSLRGCLLSAVYGTMPIHFILGPLLGPMVTRLESLHPAPKSLAEYFNSDRIFLSGGVLKG